MNRRLALVLTIFTGLIFGCQSNRKEVDVSAIDVNIRVARFDRELFNMVPDSAAVRGPALRERYPDFFDIYCHRIIPGVSGTTDPVLFFNLGNFLKDPNIRGLSVDVEQQHPDLTQVEAQLSDAFRHYRYYFPDSTIPRVVGMVSVFGAQVAALDSTLAIGLDMYMGSDYQYYQAMNFPRFKTRTMTPEFMAADAVYGWVNTSHLQPADQTDLLSRMLHNGKLMYITELLMPSAHDSIIADYAAAQLEWCKENEFNIWAHFVDEDLFFVTDEIQIHDYVEDGPFTPGLSRESPSRVGNWLGWQIVRSFMQNNPDVTPEALLAMKNPQALLDQSRYKPAR